MGIIRRSELREKVLPPVLKLALENQINEEKNQNINHQYSGFNFELYSEECKHISPTLTERRSVDTLVYPEKEDYICYENHAQDSRVKNMGDVCQNLTARMGTSGGNLPIVQEISSIAFEPGIAQREGGESRFTDEFVGTLRSNAGDNQHAVAIVEKNQECFNIATCDANGTRKDRPNGGLYITKADASKTISTGGLGNETVVVDEIIALDGDKIAKKERKGGSGFGINEDNVMYTQTAKDVHAVAYVQCVVDMMGGKAGCHISSEDVSPTITSGRGSASDVHSVAYGETEKIRTTATVRRLLPIECERLMGFPEVNVLEIGKMTKDEFIAWELAQGNISVDVHSGKVFSHRTGGGNPCPPRELKGTVLNGYKVVSLREKEVKKQCRVHRIVWIAANGLIPENMVVDHINNNKMDNCIENLQLLTSVDNSKKAHSEGLIPHHKKISDEDVWAIATLHKEHDIPIKKLVDFYGISKSRFYQLVKKQGWTQIPWKGKSPEDCPDAPRYKACGNSMCVNVMQWIGKRIDEVEKNGLFDL